MTILVFNAGSSTLKFALFDAAACDELAHGVVDWRGGGDTATLRFRTPGSGGAPTNVGMANYGEAVGGVLRALGEHGFDLPIRAVGHRVVHGGTEFRQAVRIDERVEQSLAQLAELAPLHNPPALATINATRRALPEAIHVAAFDTAYFANLPPRRFVYPVPYHWYERYGIRRFGFHGISHAYCAARATEVLGREADESLRLVICHLGNGCSATAVRGGRPVTTSMGFTPLEGLMMGTRSGSIDPGILLHLLQRHGFSAEQLEESLNRESGLLGVSGVSSDFRELEQEADAGDERARLAIELFTDRVRSTIGSLAVTLGGVDALVFTGGIGENSAAVRRGVCEGLECLGVHLDETKNRESSTDADLAEPDSSARVLLVRTREERMIAREVQRLSRG